MTNVAAFYLDHPWRLALHVVGIGLWIFNDTKQAPWLPPWRRFVPSLLMAVAWVYAIFFGDLKRVTADDALTWIACTMIVWNTLTFLNRGRGGKPFGEESAWASLTDVVRTALRREASATR